jgi:hypothetical protein
LKPNQRNFNEKETEFLIGKTSLADLTKLF